MYHVTTLIVGLLCVHWIADFVFQRQSDAEAKWNDLSSLLSHGAMYGISFIVLSWFVICNNPIYTSGFGLCMFWLINVFSHPIVDNVTSKITHKLYKQDDQHNFFVIIGLDQLIHTGLIIYTIGLLQD